MRQEIIVYKSPIEAWYWDNPQAITYVLAVMGVAFVAIMAYAWFRK